MSAGSSSVPGGNAYGDIVDELRWATGASRTTLRLDAPGTVFPVVAEALAPGVGSISDDTSINLRRAATFRFLEREQRNLVQADCTTGELAAPPELVELYGVKAQMLAPIVRKGRLVGIVSVHYLPSGREWSENDVAALDDAVRHVVQELERL